ncbi:hypothetical protein [uncultured Clostridium sp.]|uniref:hypothetical protein n=1 Tax=uncultured Clostridium sp. TaxID=59620 RepID=UPI0026182EEB|nr:hypothetical protein [uncultured Clostridium sp.]
MEIKIDTSLKGSIICPCCLGSGKLKAMQSITTFNCGSIRWQDTSVKCERCNGKGLIK